MKAANVCESVYTVRLDHAHYSQSCEEDRLIKNIQNNVTSCKINSSGIYAYTVRPSDQKISHKMWGTGTGFASTTYGYYWQYPLSTPTSVPTFKYIMHTDTY